MTTVERIKNICKSRGIPLYKLEKECGFSNGYIGGLRRGTMHYDKLQKVSEALDISMSYLALGIDIEQQESPFMQELSEITYDFSENEKQLLLEFARTIKRLNKK